MMRILAVVLVGGCLAASGCGKLNWKELSSPEGKFTVDLPGEPKKQSQTLPGTAITMHMYMVELSGGAYGVAYAELPPGTPFDYEGAIQGIANSNGGTVTKKTDWTIEGVKGKEVEMSITKPKKGFASVHIVVVNNRLYQVLGIGTSASLSDSTVKKVFDSFKITK